MSLELLDNYIQTNISTHTHWTKCLQYVVSDFLLSGKCARIRLWVKGLGWGVLHQIFSGKFRHAIKKWTQLDLKFCKNEGSIRSETNEKGGQLDRKFIQNGKHWCKILFKLDQLYVHVSLELNAIDTNWFFLHKEGVNWIWFHYAIGTNSDRQSQQRGASPQNLPTMPKYGSTPLPH